MKSYLGAVMALTLLPFFEYYRGSPHQLAAIKELEESMPSELLHETAEWFETWKASGITQKTVVPYFHQLDYDKGYRLCFSVAAAMVAAFYNVVNDVEMYLEVREEHGDTIFVKSHLKALRSLGLNAEFRTDGDDALIEAEIASGRPVMVGWLHHGDLLRGEPPMCDALSCGHWSVIVGFDREHWIMHDPMGTPDMERGGHTVTYGGKNLKVSRQAFKQRWHVEGPKSGWVILVNDE